MFARLRKLQFFKAVESCTGGYGRFRCQRVKQDDKMSDMEKSYSFHSVIVTTTHVVTTECFTNEGCTTRKPVILPCVVYT